jgi:hypothetical protein
MTNNVLAEVTALPNKSAADLKKMWKTLFSENPPTFNKTYYVKRLAYRLQEIAHGVDGSRLDKRLSAMSERELDKPAGQRKRLEVHRLATGTRLMREWNNEEHHVTVHTEGFDYRGQRYGSLSAIARKITGVRWNGLVFFGIKRQGDPAP